LGNISVPSSGVKKYEKDFTAWATYRYHLQESRSTRRTLLLGQHIGTIFKGQVVQVVLGLLEDVTDRFPRNIGT